MEYLENHFQLNAKSRKRFSFGIGIAVLLHTGLIFGVVVKEAERARAVSDLEVTMVTHFAEDEPIDADCWAQENQQASGTLDEARMLTTTTTENNKGPGDNAGLEQEQKEISVENPGEQILTTSAASLEQARLDMASNSTFNVTIASQLQSGREARLAKLDSLQQDLARRPKVGTLTSVSARARDDAAYQLHLQERITEIGNAHYPEASLSEKVFGSLRMKITIMPNGIVESVDILETSGHVILDKAALEIARLSSPFQAFSGTTATEYDKIVFIRTWQFLPSGTLKTGE